MRVGPKLAAEVLDVRDELVALRALDLVRLRDELHQRNHAVLPVHGQVQLAPPAYVMGDRAVRSNMKGKV